MAPKPPNSLAHVPLQALLDAIDDPIFIKNAEHQWLLVNSAFCHLQGRTRAELLGKSDPDFSPAMEAEIYWQMDDLVMRTGQSNVSVELHSAGGKRRTIETKKSLLVSDGNERILVGVIRDVTELTEARDALEISNRQLERKVVERTEELKITNAWLKNYAYYDPLTGLPNRRLILSSLEKLCEQGQFAVLYLDIDQFKWANDAYGHPVGDQILLEIASRLRTVTNVALCGRLGGDEFVLVTKTGVFARPELEIMLAEIRNMLATPMRAAGREWNMTASIGIAVFPEDGESATELIQHADVAMYRAKDLGRDQFAFFQAELGSRAQNFVTVETGLRNALRDENLRIALQPIVNSISGELVGYEALARWQHAQLGEISPERFIPIAESSGQIHTLFVRVARLAMAQISTWPAGVRLALNLSARQLSRPDLLRELSELLEEQNVAANRVELEITESFAFSPTDDVVSVLTNLREMGFSLALDDFGTGYSSLAQLRRMPIDRIKIDRSFLVDIPMQPRAMSLVAAIVRMAQALDLRVVAEGIETPEQRDALRQMGCDEMQGYALGRPQLLLASTSLFPGKLSK
jgi:diguanylate cyclase (GGDEF)-like protein/PAS domain S-box-containing protein